MAWNCLKKKNKTNKQELIIIVLKMIHIMSKQLQLQVYDEMLEEKNHVQNQLNHLSI
jgi:hypothetical protein